jgi:anti-sigma factor RsiW
LLGYLEDGLSADERQAFALHLEQCPDCRRQLDQQRRIDHLLRQGAGDDVPVPPGLTVRVERRLRAARRRRLAVWAGALAAAVLLAVGVSAWLMRPVPTPEPLPAPATVKVEPPPAPPQVPHRLVAEVTITPAQGLVAVPVPTRDPSVTILWVFPDRQAAVPAMPKLIRSEP